MRKCIQKISLFLCVVVVLGLTITPHAFAQENTNDTTIFENNVPDIVNELHEKYSTEGNEAKFDNGDVVTVPGDVETTVAISNLANVNAFDEDCNCEKEQPVAPIGGTTAPTSQTTPSNSGFNPVAEAITHLASGPNLLITRNNWLVLALFGNIMMLLWGAYLRLRSGRSPGYAFAL